MLLVSCSIEYWEFVRNLRLDVRVLSGFLNTNNIDPKQQLEYMKKYSDCYRIALLDGEPAGYVGVVENDIRVCTHPDYQGKGVGKFMINSAIEIWPKAEAKVKIGNEASSSLFLACGFVISSNDNNFLYYKKIFCQT
jgi:GNAT superfamily N-acetyltransferase